MVRDCLVNLVYAMAFMSFVSLFLHASGYIEKDVVFGCIFSMFGVITLLMITAAFKVVNDGI